MASATSVSWRGVTIAMGADYHLRELVGWEELPNVTFEGVPASSSYGSLVTAGQCDPRIVTVTGWCYSTSARDALLAGFWAACAPHVGELVTESLTVAHGGLTLSVDAQLMKASAAPEAGWAVGRFGFVLTWRCPDPLRYGSPQTVSSPIQTATTGLTFPITFPITFPSNPIGGTAVVRNAGNARSPVLITLTGPLEYPGVVTVESSKRVWFPLTLGASDVVTIDSRAGVARLNGEFRAPAAGSALLSDLFAAPAATTSFQALGTPSSGSPGISVQFRPAFW